MSMAYPSIRIRPLWSQFVVSEGMTVILVVVLFAIIGYESLLPDFIKPYLLGLGLFLILYLFYRYMFITRTVYIITEEQLKYEFGIFSCKRDYIELYRVVDYSEQRSFLQILLGIKTISIFSGDRTNPRLDLIGIQNDYDLIAVIRERVEINKRKRNIHEFTNIK